MPTKWPGNEPNKLTKWHKAHRRDFPWRENPDPYHVLVAEFMLQRTQPVQVDRVYPAFLKRWPTLQAAAQASEEDLAHVLLPLGRLGRAQQLARGLRYVQQEWGRVPEDLDNLMQIPGVGAYIARAVLCFAFKQPRGVIDPGIVRIFHRFFGISSKRARAHTDRELWKVADELAPNRGCDRYNLALLDLAALVCLPSHPRHDECPIDENCRKVDVNDNGWNSETHVYRSVQRCRRSG